MRLLDENLHDRTVITSDGLAIGSIGALSIDSDSWRVESLQVKLHKDVADRLGADRSWLHSGALDIPTRMVQSAGDAVILSAGLEELRRVLPEKSEPTKPGS